MDGTSALPETERDRDVAAFLCAHPDFLAVRPELYRTLTPPERIHGDTVTDHLAAMLARARRDAAAMAETAEAVLAAGRQAAGALTQVQSAVLALLDAPDAAECVVAELPRLLGADAARIVRDDRMALEYALGGAEVLFRDHPPDAPSLYQEAAPLARFDVLVRLPGHGVLALAYRAPPHQGSGAAAGDLRRHLAFLGQVIGALLRRGP